MCGLAPEAQHRRQVERPWQSVEGQSQSGRDSADPLVAGGEGNHGELSPRHHRHPVGAGSLCLPFSLNPHIA